MAHGSIRLLRDAVTVRTPELVSKMWLTNGTKTETG